LTTILHDSVHAVNIQPGEGAYQTPYRLRWGCAVAWRLKFKVEMAPGTYAVIEAADEHGLDLVIIKPRTGTQERMRVQRSTFEEFFEEAPV
jgi:hypothetical protein